MIPKAVRDHWAIGKNGSLELELQGDVLTVRPTKDMAAIRKHFEKYRGYLSGQLEAEGYTSVEGYIDDVRGRDAEYKRVMGMRR